MKNPVTTPLHTSFTSSSTGFAAKPVRDSNAMDVDATCKHGPNPVVCYRCGKTGHTRHNCPEAFDVHTMTTKERSDFVERELTAFYVCIDDANKSEDAEEVKEKTAADADFTSRNK